METATEVDVTQLSSSLRGEPAAVETCDQAIARLGDEPMMRTKLEGCRISHQRLAGRCERHLHL